MNEIVHHTQHLRFNHRQSSLSLPPRSCLLSLPLSLEPSGKGQIPYVVGEEMRRCPMSLLLYLISSDSDIWDTCAGNQSNCTLTSGPRALILITISMTTATESQSCGFPLIGAGCRDGEEGLSEE